MGEGDNGCDSELLMVASNMIANTFLYILQIEQHSLMLLCRENATS